METWGLARGTKVRIIRGLYAGHNGTVESNVHQRTAGDPDEGSNGYRIELDAGNLVFVRWEWVEIPGDKARTENRETLSGSTFAEPL